jgi:acyl-CoA thioesterase
MDEKAVTAAFQRALYQPETGHTFLHRFMDVRIDYADDRTVTEFDVSEAFFNRQGKLHGGIIALLFDMTMGNLHRNGNDVGVTLEMKVNYMRPVESGRIRAEATFLKKGRSISVIESRMYNGDALVASATATWQRVAK